MIKEDKKHKWLRRLFIGISIPIAFSFMLKNVSDIRRKPNMADLIYAFNEDCKKLYGKIYVDYICLRPNVKIGMIETNSNGVWGGEIRMPKPSNVYRVACIGGSTTVGRKEEGILFAWPEYLQKFLDDRSSNDGINYEVINFGMRGSESGLAVRRLERLAFNYDIDMVISDLGWNDMKQCRFFGNELNEMLEKFLFDNDFSRLVLYDGWFNANNEDYWVKKRNRRFEQVRMFAKLNNLKLGSFEDFADANRKYIFNWEDNFQNKKNELELPKEIKRDNVLKSLYSVNYSSLFANIPFELMMQTEYANNLVSIVETSLEAKVKPVLLTINGLFACKECKRGMLYERKCVGVDVEPQDFGDYMAGSLPRLIKGLVDEYKENEVLVVDTFEYFESLNKSKYFSDLEHPNDEGCKEIAKLLMPVVIKEAELKFDERERR